MKQLYKLATQKTRIPVLNTILVKDGMAWGTDIDSYIGHPCDKPDGLYNAHKAKANIWANPDEIAPDDFPSIPNELTNMEYDATLPASDLKWVSAAMCEEKARYYLCGIYFDTECLVATNGHILKRIDAKGPVKPFIMPDHMVDAILASGSDNVRIWFNGLTIFAYAGDYTIIAKAIDGTFPDYRRVIPSRDTGLPFDTVDFKTALKRVKELDKVSGTKNRLIRLRDNGRVEYAGNRDIQEDLFKLISGPNFDIGFNCELMGKGDLSGLVYFGQYAQEPVLVIDQNKTFVIIPTRII